jgi:hypothetical protein
VRECADHDCEHCEFVIRYLHLLLLACGHCAKMVTVLESNLQECDNV